MLFSELLDADDFGCEAGSLAGDFRERYGLPPVHQVGLVVPDVEAAARQLEERGLGPFLILSGEPSTWLEGGRPGKFQGKVGMAFHHGFELELLEPGEGSDHYRRSLDPGGGIVVQHVGLLVDDVDQWAARLNAAGHATMVRGQLKVGPLRFDFAHLDTRADAGLLVEFISARLLGRPSHTRPGLIRRLGSFQKWTGKRCWSF